MASENDNIRIVYFDVGNVILRFSNSVEAIAKLLQTDMDQLMPIWNAQDPKLWTGQINLAELWRIFKTELKYTGQDIDLIQYWQDFVSPIDETHQLLEEIAPMYPIGLLTNVYPGLHAMGVEKGTIPKNIQFRDVIESCAVGIAKPDIRIFQLAEQRSGFGGSEILFVDDRQDNLEVAQSLGWVVVQFNPENPAQSANEVRNILKI